MARVYYVYILTNRHRTVLYTGVTNDVALVMKASFASLASASVKGRSTSFSCRSPASTFKVCRVMPARHPDDSGGVSTRPFMWEPEKDA